MKMLDGFLSALRLNSLAATSTTAYTVYCLRCQQIQKLM